MMSFRANLLTQSLPISVVQLIARIENTRDGSLDMQVTPGVEHCVKVLEQMREEGLVECLRTGRAARW